MHIAVFLQHFSIVARDLGKHPRTSSRKAKVIVYVVRNDNPPRFHDEPYTRSIQRDANENAAIFKVNATDSDSVVSGPMDMDLYHCLSSH